MKFVQPIRHQWQIDEIKEYLKKRNERDYMLFTMGINIGLRISDILPFRVFDVLRSHIDVIEKKTGKRKIIKINDKLRSELDEYIDGMPRSAYLFASRSRKHITGRRGEPITSSQAYKIMKGIGDRFGIPDLGTHSLRKTFGYHFYLKTKDVALLMDLFNHSDPKVTLRYIGIIQDTLDDAMEGLFL